MEDETLRGWTVKEEKKVKEEYREKGSIVLAKELKRSKHSIRKKAQRLKVSAFREYKTRTLTEYEKGFIEGFLDADGCITLNQGRNLKPKVIVCFANNSIEILEKIAKIIGEVKPPRLISKRPGYELRIQRQSVVKNILSQISLIVKEPRRKIALKLLEYDRTMLSSKKRPANYHNVINKLVNEFKNS
jgi:hypothetical protein